MSLIESVVVYIIADQYTIAEVQSVARPVARYQSGKVRTRLRVEEESRIGALIDVGFVALTAGRIVRSTARDASRAFDCRVESGLGEYMIPK